MLLRFIHYTEILNKYYFNGRMFDEIIVHVGILFVREDMYNGNGQATYVRFMKIHIFIQSLF